jgi:hypothetical protein
LGLGLVHASLQIQGALLCGPTRPVAAFALRLGAPQLHATALELGMGTPAQVAGKVAYYRLQSQAFVIGFDHMMWVMAIFFSLALIPLYFLKAPAHLGPAEAH